MFSGLTNRYDYTINELIDMIYRAKNEWHGYDFNYTINELIDMIYRAKNEWHGYDFSRTFHATDGETQFMDAVGLTGNETVEGLMAERCLSETWRQPLKFAINHAKMMSTAAMEASDCGTAAIISLKKKNFNSAIDWVIQALIIAESAGLTWIWRPVVEAIWDFSIAADFNLFEHRGV